MLWLRLLMHWTQRLMRLCKTTAQLLLLPNKLAMHSVDSVIAVALRNHTSKEKS